MKSSWIVVAALALGAASLDADAARRFGGGGNLGKQRATPTAKEATPAAPATPTQTPASQPAPAQAAPASAAAAQPKPSFMSRWGGLLAGLGIGAILASLFGAQLAPIIGAILAMLLLGAVVYFVFRWFAGARREPEAPRAATVPFAGIGSAVAPTPGELERGAPLAASPAAAVRDIRPSFEVEPFLRVAKTSFIRLQAANDAKDLDDIRDYTTSEMYAEIAMQVAERGDAPQRTEVVSVEARLVDVDIEDGFEIASVRFWGLIRESPGANPESFDEIWHVRKKLGERNAGWLIAGIQQTEPAL